MNGPQSSAHRPLRVGVELASTEIGDPLGTHRPAAVPRIALPRGWRKDSCRRVTLGGAGPHHWSRLVRVGRPGVSLVGDGPAPTRRGARVMRQSSASGIPPEPLRDAWGNPVWFGDPPPSKFPHGGVPQAHGGGPMSACLLCQYNIPKLDTPLGRPGDPVGLCRSCSSLSCGWHGALTSPEFTCIVCDAGELLASAGWEKLVKAGGLDDLRRKLRAGLRPGRGGPEAGASDEEAGLDLARALASTFSGADRDPSAWVVASLDQWFAERPHYRSPTCRRCRCAGTRPRSRR